MERAIRTSSLATFTIVMTQLIAGAVHADEPRATVALSWIAPAECIDAPTLERAVERMLEHPVWAPPEMADVAIDASLTRDAAEWVLHLTLRNGDVILGTREARRRGADCRGIDGVIVVVVALLVDLPRRDVQLRVAPETLVPIEEPESTPEPIPTPEPRGDRPEMRVGVEMLFDLGTLPGPAFGGDLSAAITPGASWPALRLSGRALSPSETPLDAEGRGARVWLVGGAFDVCPEAFFEPVVLGLCGGIGIDTLVATGRGLGIERDAIGFRGSARADGNIAVRFGIVDVRLSAGANFAFVRDSFVRDRGTSVETVLFEPAWVSFAVTLGVSIRIIS
jgi:hypothetical protein